MDLKAARYRVFYWIMFALLLILALVCLLPLLWILLSSFKTPKGESRSAWENLRRSRISTPKSIKVEISDLNISMDSNTQARVTFKQNYRASHLSQRTGKTLVMINTNGQWLIEQEMAQR